MEDHENVLHTVMGLTREALVKVRVREAIVWDADGHLLEFPGEPAFVELVLTNDVAAELGEALLRSHSALSYRLPRRKD